jgi:hypothetical protein
METCGMIWNESKLRIKHSKTFTKHHNQSSKDIIQMFFLGDSFNMTYFEGRFFLTFFR